jgi:integrase
MAYIEKNKSGGKVYLRLCFVYRKVLCRENLDERITKGEAKRLKDLIQGEINEELRGGKAFNYAEHFPQGKHLAEFAKPDSAGGVTVLDQWQAYMNTLEVEPETMYDYECLRRVFLEKTPLGAMLLTAVKANDIREVIRASTADRRKLMFLQRLRATYRLAIQDELIDRNPADLVQNPKKRRRRRTVDEAFDNEENPREVVDPYTETELAQLYNAAQSQRDRQIMMLLVETGIRPGELCAMRREFVNVKNRKLTVAFNKARYGLKDTKTTGSFRNVDLSPQAMKVLGEILSATVTPLRGLLFINRKGGGYLNWSNWSRRYWRKIVERAGVRYQKPYALRHTFAVRLLEANRDPVYIARQMGHTSTEMVHRHYGRWVREAMSSTETRAL